MLAHGHEEFGVIAIVAGIGSRSGFAGIGGGHAVVCSAVLGGNIVHIRKTSQALYIYVTCGASVEAAEVGR
jgi:hypothetical protein